MPRWRRRGCRFGRTKILPGTGRGTVAEGDGGGGSPRNATVPYADTPLHHPTDGPPPRGAGRIFSRAKTPYSRLMATTALAAHSGVAPPREGFAFSDVATFVAFAFMVVLARRAIRNRKRRN